jgi:hypothetical protein
MLLLSLPNLTPLKTISRPTGKAVYAAAFLTKSHASQDHFKANRKSSLCCCFPYQISRLSRPFQGQLFHQIGDNDLFSQSLGNLSASWNNLKAILSNTLTYRQSHGHLRKPNNRLRQSDSPFKQEYCLFQAVSRPLQATSGLLANTWQRKALCFMFS